MALLGLALVALSGDWSPAVTPEVAQMRLWIAARAAGVVSLLLLTGLTVLGIVISHPLNKTDWKASKHVFPWHKHLALFTLSFIGVHIATLVADPYAGVGLGGAFVPGLSGYRTWPVAVGTVGLYALLITGITARFTGLLGKGRWLTIHRIALSAFVMAWGHGVAAGTDTAALLPVYAATGATVLVFAASRYWNPLMRPRRGEPEPERFLAPRIRFDLWR